MNTTTEDPATLGDAVKSGLLRDQDSPDAARLANVTEWQKRVTEAKVHWKGDFKRMRDNMDFTSGKQWPGQNENDDRYQANFVQRVIKTQVASLYAKNPTVVAQRRKRMNYQIWDGKMASLQSAIQDLQNAAATGQPPAQSSIALYQDVESNYQRVQMIDKIGTTLETLIEYYMSEQIPGFKLQMKQMIRRIRTAGVGYIKLGFQREMDLSDDQNSRIADMTERLAVIGQLQSDMQDGEIEKDSAEADQLRLSIAAIQAEPEMITREGLVWGFPQATRIIPSPETTKVNGWIGAPWLAEEVLLTPDRIKQVYGVDVGKEYSSYKIEAGKPWSGNKARTKQNGKGLACVWHIYDRDSGLEYVVCDGYKDFLKEPGSPDVQVEQFFPIWGITFNEVENEEELFPKSDVELMKHIQREYNRAKEAMRQHRIANRPLYLAPDGQFDEDEQKSLAGHAAHDVIIVKALKDGVKVQDLIAPVQKVGVDPNLYETESLFMDMMRVVGTQQANIGGTASGTATESSIAQQSMNTANGLDSDDFDDMLSSVMRAAGQILLMNLTKETVIEIAGPGAVWPEMSRHEIVAEISLEIKAGSAGRPNQAQEAATLERLYPLLVQIPGIRPEWLAGKAIKVADDNIDLEDAFLDGLPSIMSQNAQRQPPTGNPATEPAGQGGGNAPPQAITNGTAKAGFPQGAQPNQI